MEYSHMNIKLSKTIKLFNKLNIIWYLASLTDVWIFNVQLPKTFLKFYDPYLKVLHYFTIVFLVITTGALFTQRGLSHELENRMMSSIISCGCIVSTRLVIFYHTDDVRKLLYHLTVTLKEYNNIEIERSMTLKIKYFSYGFFCSTYAVIILRGIECAFEAYKGEYFNAFVAIWPKVDDPSPAAEIARYCIYMVWFIFGLQACGTLQVTMAVMIAISYQYKYLTNYFYELHNIFMDTEKSQLEKEREYFEKLTKGFYWHSLTLWCVKTCQRVHRITYSVYLMLGTLLIVYSLPQMVNPESNAKVMLGEMLLVFDVLIFIGIIMWNAGDITVEASKLPNALFGSGWYCCSGGAGKRARKMIIFAMQQAQQPVVMKACGTFELSYESYVFIVKFSYSLFSVMVN